MIKAGLINSSHLIKNSCIETAIQIINYVHRNCSFIVYLIYLEGMQHSQVSQLSRLCSLLQLIVLNCF